MVVDVVSKKTETVICVCVYVFAKRTCVYRSVFVWSVCMCVCVFGYACVNVRASARARACVNALPVKTRTNFGTVLAQ